MTATEHPVELATRRPVPRGWTTGRASLLLGGLAVALLPVAHYAVVRAAFLGLLSLFTGSGTGAPLWIAAAAAAVLLTAAATISAIAFGIYALVRGRDQVLAGIGVTLGLVPFAAVATLALSVAR